MIKIDRLIIKKHTSTSSSVEIKGTCVSKNLDETVRLQSEIRREWIREIREERLQRIPEGASSAHRLASSSAVSSATGETSVRGPIVA